MKRSSTSILFFAEAAWGTFTSQGNTRERQHGDLRECRRGAPLYVTQKRNETVRIYQTFLCFRILMDVSYWRPSPPQLRHAIQLLGNTLESPWPRRLWAALLALLLSSVTHSGGARKYVLASFTHGSRAAGQRHSHQRKQLHNGICRDTERWAGEGRGRRQKHIICRHVCDQDRFHRRWPTRLAGDSHLRPPLPPPPSRGRKVERQSAYMRNQTHLRKTVFEFLLAKIAPFLLSYVDIRRKPICVVKRKHTDCCSHTMSGLPDFTAEGQKSIGIRGQFKDPEAVLTLLSLEFLQGRQEDGKVPSAKRRHIERASTAVAVKHSCII